jgi:pimeloyl-ACP methyl ester carboxylesterase
MGAFETVEAGGTTARLYTAGPVNPGTRAVVVLHPWWGLNEDVIAYADRLVAEGFAIARQHVSRVPIIAASSQLPRSCGHSCRGLTRPGIIMEPGVLGGGPPGYTTRIHGRPTMPTAPIILVPGFWLGAWAWDEVADLLRADGHDVTALTLPGLESAEADRSTVTLSDHVDAIVDAVRRADAPVVLAVHSASGFSGYAASDRVPDRIAAMVYVDTAPGKGALDPDFAGKEKPLVWKDIEAEENLDGLTEAQKETFRRRAVPVPGGVLRGSIELTNDARRDIPSTFMCTGFTAEQYQSSARDHPEWAFLAGIPDLRNTTWIDLPTSHWPMWSAPQDTARIIGEVAKAGVPVA